MPKSMGIVLDCADPERLAPFWAEALGYSRAPGDYDPYVVLVAPEDRPGPMFLLQKVAEPKAVKNRMHLDINGVDDLEGEAWRLETHGARRLEGPVSEHATTWIVMADPEGNEFCVCSSRTA